MTSGDALQLDGRHGEGGGQVVRSCLSLAAITGRPFVLDHVRGNREKPGLRRQHMTAVRAAAEICGARVEGNQLHSAYLAFAPDRLRCGHFTLDIGTAGSTTLVLQTILPALMVADGRSTVTLRGGTHNPLAPSFEFLERAFLPIVRAMGVGVRAELKRYGFYPAGGGELVVEIEPAAGLQRLELLEAGKLLRRRVEAIVAGLPRHIAEREVDTVVRRSGWPKIESRIHEVQADCPGNSLLIELKFEHVTELVTACGRRGLPAEKVASGCLREAQDYLRQEVPVGVHLADQILLPCALAAHRSNQTSRFRTGPLSLHSLTHIDIIRQFLDVTIDHQTTDQGVMVCIAP